MLCQCLNLQLEIKIPLVKLSFASKTGLKRIPKKRPPEKGPSETLLTVEWNIIPHSQVIKTVGLGMRLVALA